MISNYKKVKKIELWAKIFRLFDAKNKFIENFQTPTGSPEGGGGRNVIQFRSQALLWDFGLNEKVDFSFKPFKFFNVH